MLPAPSFGSSARKAKTNPRRARVMSVAKIDPRYMEELESLTSLNRTTITSSVVAARMCGLTIKDVIVLSREGIFAEDIKGWTPVRQMYLATQKKPQDTALYLAAGLIPSELEKLRADGTLTHEVLQTLITLRNRNA